MNINIDNLNKNSLIMQWNVDTNGNPASVRIENEVQQISTTHNLIQLAQIPDEYYGVQIGVDGESNWLKEVYNRDEIALNTYYVDYGLGYVYFDETHKGKVVIANYYGRGVILLSDSRIFHTKGSTFVDTWDNIIERSKDALELLESSGGLANAIKTIDEKVEQGNQVANRIEDFISETEFYGYTILLSREAFVIKAKEDGNVETGEYGDIYTDVVVYKGATQVTTPTLNISLTNQVNCEFEVIGQRIKLKTGSMNVDAIKGQATVVIDCGDGLVAHRIIEVTKVFDGVSQYQVEIGNSFYSFNANSDGKIEEEQSVTCDINVTKANELYESYMVTIQNMPKGMTHNIVNGTKANNVTFTAVAGTSLPDNGSVSIVVQMADNTVINKTFSFSKTKQGVDAKSLILTGNQIIKYDTPDYTGTPSPYRSIIHAQVSGLSGTPNWYVLNENEEWELIIGQSSTTLEVYYNDSVIWKDRKETTIKCKLDGYSDEITLIKIANGATGSDAYSILLSNEATTIPTDVNGVAPTNEIQKHYTSINVYRGAERISPTNIEVESSEEELYEVSVSGNTIRLINISSNVESVTIPIEVVVDGLTFKRSWNISKSKQGVTGVSGSTLVLNVDGGTRSIIYNQMNVNPIPSASTQFIARLYDNGEEVIGNVGYYWSCVGHVSGTSTSKTFTPSIADTYSESISSNQITVVATYKGNKISHTVPVVISKTVEGLDWVTDWDSTKVSIRGAEVLTPKIFAGTYNQANDSVTGVAIGQDVLNDGQTIGIVAYQDNTPTLLVGTDGSIEIGDPYQNRSANGVGIGYNNGQFVGRFSQLTIAGVEVPTEEVINDKINQAVSVAQNQLQAEVEEVNNALVDLNDYVNGSLKDGMLDEVEKVKIEGLMEIINQEISDVQGQYISISTNHFLTDPFIIEALEVAYQDYDNAYIEITSKYNDLMQGNTSNSEEFIESISNFRNTSNNLYQVMNKALVSISETQATQISEDAKNEVIKEVNDVSDALAGLEDTMNGEFKTGLIGSINLSNLNERLKQLDIEKKDIDGQYSVISTNTALDSTTKNKLVSAKGTLDSAHTTLVTKINSVVSDNLLTTAELEEVNNLIVAYSTALGEYSKVAQEANIAIAVNTAKNTVDAITDEQVFNKVTNFGKTQGLFIENGGKVYINAQYIQTRGFVATKDEGTKTFEIDKNGNVNIVANSFTLTGDAITNVATKEYVDSSISNVEFDETDLTQEGVFNALTNNGQTQGIYLEDNKVYINGEYIQTGTIRADLVKVQIDGKENILPFNYVTFKSGIESWLNIDETNEGIPFIEAEIPIYQGGGSNSYFCRKLGNSTVYLEPNTRYFFSCDIYAYVPRDRVETYGVGGSTGTGAELTLMTAMSERYVTEGRYVPIFIINSLVTETTEGQWTRKVYEFTTPAESEFYSLSNHMYIELNGSNYNTGSYGYVQIANMALEKAVEGQVTASTFDYLTQLKERRIDLSDDKFYHTRLSVDGFSTEEGIIEGTTSTDGHDYKLNYDGLNVYKSPRERYFVGKDKAYYSYTAGSSGVISGHSDIYGVGGVHCNPSDEYAGYRGIFAGVHYGFQIPNSTAFGRPDIYVHNGEWGLDFEEWQLLGDIIEPRGLVRRDDSKNITTNHQLKFLVGGGTDTANVWNQEQYNTTGNGQMLTYSAGKVYVSNPQTPLVLESSADPVVKVGNTSEQKLIHAGNLTDRGIVYGVARNGSSNVADLNNLWRSGFYDMSNGNNAPNNNKDWWWVINSAHTSNSEGYKYGLQIGAMNISDQIWWRATNQYGVGTWYRFYHTGYQQTSTSDIRYKRVLSKTNIDDCYDMVKNIQLNSYLLLDDEEQKDRGLDVDKMFLQATQEEGVSRKLQMGVIAQDLLDYECGQYVVVQDVEKDKETGEVVSDKYSIDAYNYASAILGGLQKEIQVRDEQYEELKQENDELKNELDEVKNELVEIKQMLMQVLGQE